MAAGVYACLALVFVGPGLVPGRTLSGSELLWTYVPWRASAPGDISPTQNFNLNDAVFVFQPFLAFTISVLPDVPLWNPNLMSGRPFLANAQSAVFSPFSLPAYVLPFWSSLAVIAALKIFVAAFGTYLLGRALHMRMGGALLAGLTYGFSLWIVSWLSWPQSSVWALIPWLVLVTERLIRRPGPLEVAGLAGVVAIQFLGGHPESSRDALLAPLVFFACRLASTSGLDLRQVVRRCAGFAAALVLGAGLSALTIVPFLDLVRDSADITERTAVGGEGTSARFLLGLFVPNYWGRPGTTSADPFITFFTDRAFYVGALGLMLAAAAVVSHPARERIAVACFGGAALAVSLGLPPFDVLFSALPGQDALRADRLTPLFLITLAVLAGWGLDDLSARDAAPRRGRLVAVCCGALACAPVVWMAVIGTLSLDHLRTALDLAWGFATPAPGFFENSARPQVVRLGALLEWIVLAAAAVALVTLRLRRSIPASLFVLLALGLAVVDLFKAGMGFNPAVPVDRAEQPATGAIRYLQARRPERFTALDGGLSTRTMPVDVAMRYGLADARGRDFPIDARYKAFWARNIALSAAAPASRLIVRRLTPRALHALSLLSVANILLDPREPVPATGGLRTAYTGPDARIVKNERALPHTFLVERQQVVAGADEALAAVSDTTFDAHRFAITERPLPGLARAPARSGSRGRARIETYEAERVVVGATAPRPSLLVLTDSYARGWKVTVDGVSAPLHRVDYLLRGVMVPAGAHRVEFRYQPASWRIGWIISAVSVLILAALISAGVVARRRLRP